MSMHEGDVNGEEGREVGLDQARRRLPEQQQQPKERGQQSRADFLRAGASMVGFAGAVLGVQQQVGEMTHRRVYADSCCAYTVVCVDLCHGTAVHVSTALRPYPFHT